jgi:hypothetical protein
VSGASIGPGWMPGHGTTTGRLESGFTHPASDPDDVYKRPYEGTDNSLVAMQGYIDWELVAQLERDGTHRFRVI